ncbi:hypothetical protein ET475_16600 [Microbacterium protaetiae]|uniref:Uncharacterized protein n=1 Tax=Microbacterium protaetiae TaxID=2509458 RepID=A0A4P6EGH9_9MICO|nr:hypothetical protein [Microbacterium protaetiae]QAY61424.1 hypothetical protein ET475_16600 [Microbacterium protaetiae]
MSTPDQPSTPPLTRRQLRELRNTGVTPVITPDTSAVSTPETPEAAAVADAAPAPEAPAATPAPAAERPATPLPRAAEPAPVHTAPVPDQNVDLGATPLTRRQARQQERIRTASVPVITPDIAGAVMPTSAATATGLAERSPWAPPVDEEPDAAPQPVVEAVAESRAVPETPATAESPAVAESHVDVVPDAPAEAEEEASFEQLLGVRDDDEDAASAPESVSAAPERPVLNPAFGARVLAGDTKTPEPATSFEQLLTRDTSSTGSVSAPHALIMSQTSAPLVAPIAGTGEVLVTGTFALPEGLGSTGHAAGTADGKEVDAILVDGELPAHSSPTPIAASAAVSTIKSSEDVIQAPAPEKGGKLMLSLAITAGVLALALVGVLVYALASGVIS